MDFVYIFYGTISITTTCIVPGLCFLSQSELRLDDITPIGAFATCAAKYCAFTLLVSAVLAKSVRRDGVSGRVKRDNTKNPNGRGRAGGLA